MKIFRSKKRLTIITILITLSLLAGGVIFFLAKKNFSFKADSVIPDQCSDGIDNDGDGTTDAQDVSCQFNSTLESSSTDNLKNLPIMTLAEIKAKFDAMFELNRQYYLDTSNTGYSGKYYYSLGTQQGFLDMYLATDDMKYLDFVLEIETNMMDKATTNLDNSVDGTLDWLNTNTCNVDQREGGIATGRCLPLVEATPINYRRIGNAFAETARVIHEKNLGGAYATAEARLIDFTEKNIVPRLTNAIAIPHMDAHDLTIFLDLYKIKGGDQYISKVTSDIGTMIAKTYDNANDSKAIVFNSTVCTSIEPICYHIQGDCDHCTGAGTGEVDKSLTPDNIPPDDTDADKNNFAWCQKDLSSATGQWRKSGGFCYPVDISHANDYVRFAVKAYDEGIGFDKNYIEKLGYTFKKYIWKDHTLTNMNLADFIDGAEEPPDGKYKGTGSPGSNISNGWTKLAQYDPEIQVIMQEFIKDGNKNSATLTPSYLPSFWGALAVNTKSYTYPKVPTVDIKANGSKNVIEIDSGTSAVLSWTSSDATSCTASNDWTGDRAISGSESTGILTVSKSYILTCKNGPFETMDSIAVNIKGMALPKPTVVLKINNSISTATVKSGQSATLSWETTNASSCIASGSWTGEKTKSGSISTGSLTKSKTYTLKCDNGTGAETKSVSVTVSGATSSPLSKETIISPVESTNTPNQSIVDNNISTGSITGVSKTEALNTGNITVAVKPKYQIVDVKEDITDIDSFEIDGTATPNLALIIYIHSPQEIIKFVNVDSQGKWKLSINDPLTAGEHEIRAAVKNNDGTRGEKVWIAKFNVKKYSDSIFYRVMAGVILFLIISAILVIYFLKRRADVRYFDQVSGAFNNSGDMAPGQDNHEWRG